MNRFYGKMQISRELIFWPIKCILSMKTRQCYDNKIQMLQRLVITEQNLALKNIAYA